MKTIKPFYKVTGIIFLMYFHLMLVTAIGYRVNQKMGYTIDHKQGSGIIINHAGEAPQSVVNDFFVPMNESVAPVPDPEPEIQIENWMLEPDYLEDSTEPEIRIEDWMLDSGYLDDEVEL